MKKIPLAARLGLLLLNGVPLLHAATVALPWIATGFLAVPEWGSAAWGAKLGWSIAWLYLAPPLGCRLLFFLFGKPPVRTPAFSRPFFVWWATVQLNALFVRFPAFEELLRLFPGFYSSWLRLWGAKVGRLVFWGGRLTLLDRSFVEIGDDVMVGFGVFITPHFVSRLPDGSLELTIAAPKVGDRALLGGGSGLAPGCEVAPGEMLPATLGLAPFYLWKEGRRRRKPDAPLDALGSPR
jgi:hypothetical protein